MVSLDRIDKTRPRLGLFASTIVNVFVFICCAGGGLAGIIWVYAIWYIHKTIPSAENLPWWLTLMLGALGLAVIFCAVVFIYVFAQNLKYKTKPPAS